MATKITLEGEVRNEFGKGVARRLRVANLIPASIYAGGAEPVHVTLPMRRLLFLFVTQMLYLPLSLAMSHESQLLRTFSATLLSASLSTLTSTRLRLAKRLTLRCQCLLKVLQRVLLLHS